MTKKEQKYMKHLMDNKDSYQIEIYEKLEKMAETIEQTADEIDSLGNTVNNNNNISLN